MGDDEEGGGGGGGQPQTPVRNFGQLFYRITPEASSINTAAAAQNTTRNRQFEICVVASEKRLSQHESSNRPIAESTTRQ